MFYLRTKGGNYVSGVSRGLLLVTKDPTGYPSRHGGRTNSALGFASPAEAKEFLASYASTKLPKGKTHTELEIVEGAAG